ncbi:MAG: Signal transduction histidine kinase, partial [Ignavibacteriaceae bacterium]|nr:Signal transduction histidine kinase [Ignavibacteriaceae bacterium]
TSGDIKFSTGKDNAHLKLFRKEITGKNIGEVFNSNTKQKILEGFSTAVRLRKSQFVQLDIRSEDTHIPTDCKIDPVIGDTGYVQFLYLIFKEIPETNPEILPKFQEFNELNFYKEIVQKNDTAVIVVSKNGEVIFSDELIQKFTGIKDKENGKLLITNLFPQVTQIEFQNIIKELTVNNQFEFNTFIDHITDGRIPVKLTFFNSETDSSVVIVVCNKRLNVVVQQQENKSEVSESIIGFEETIDPVIKIDSSGKILLANQSLKLLLNFPDIDLYSKNFFDLIKSDEPIIIKDEMNTLKIGEKKSLPIKIKNYASDEIQTNLILQVEQTIDGLPYIFYCTLSKSYKIERKVLPESIHKSLFTASQDGMAVESDGKLLLTNNSFAKIFKYNDAFELQNKNVIELVSEKDIPRLKEYFNSKKSGSKTPERIEFLAKAKNGSTFYAEFSVTAFKQESQTFLVIMAVDATERKRTQQVIRESEQKYRNITENIDDFLYTFERAGKYFRPLFFTTAVQKVTGYTQDEFLSDSRFLLKIIHPDDFQDVKKKLKNLWVSTSGATSELDLRIINKEGNVVWVRNKLNIVRDSEKRIKKIYGLVSDITLNKRAEEELKESAENLKKLNEAKDRFLSIISHDLRTPFSSILGFTDLLIDDDTLSDFEKKQYISYIQDSSKSMLALVNSLLDWTRLQTGRIKFEPEKINAEELINSSINTVSGNAMKKGIKIQNLVDSSHYLFTIDVKSEYEKGTEFIFSLPVASAKILLVEPNKRDRILYSKILMSIASDYAVSIVSNGSEALERIISSPPALVITENQMPVMSGYNLVQELIKSGLKSATPVIILTSKIERSAVQQYTELGIEHIFTKPVNLRSFKEAIEKSIRKSLSNNNHSK